MDATRLLAGNRIVPVVVLASATAAVPVARALLDGGMAVAEITLRTDGAVDGIRAIATEVPDMLVGAGSIRTPEQMKVVQDAGAAFCVSPGASSALLDAAEELRMPFIPGAATPSEMIGLFERGYRLQKFFPAEQAGGAGFLKSVGGPLPDIAFMPTGGITPANADQYLRLANVACIGGSWIAPVSKQSSGDFSSISDLARESLRLSR